MASNDKAVAVSTNRAWIFLAVTLIITIWAGFIFRGMFEQEPIIAGPGVTEEKMLSDFIPSIADSPSDTAIFVLEGDEPGGTFVLFGGTHPQEVSGVLAATLLVENAQVEQGRVIVVPQANQSGFTYTEPLQAFPHTFEIETADGSRWFRNGMRLSNPVHQWPDPELY